MPTLASGRTAPARPLAALGDAMAIVRLHIVGVAVAGALTFGWLMTGRYLVAVSAVVALDWLLINLVNRVTDLEEDGKNQVPGTARVARHRRAILAVSISVLVGSLAAGALVWPRLLVWRLAVHAIGLAYNFELVPTPRGLRRLKEIYLAKNLGSAVLFVLTCFVYPLAAAPSRLMAWPAIVCLVAFFVPFEMTYEILYDLRDLEGDRALGVPTFPVVHGVRATQWIIYGLLAASALALLTGVGLGALGLREALMLVAPAAQLAFLRSRRERGLTHRDCVLLTHLGTAQLALFLLGTALWLRAGLPANLFL